MADSGLVKEAKSNTTESQSGYCGRCGVPSTMCTCSAKPTSEAPGEPAGDKNVLDVGFGKVDDEHGSGMFKGLK